MTSRTQRRIGQNLGIVDPHSKIGVLYRSERLKKLEDYYYNRQHDDKIPWLDAERAEAEIPLGMRKPLVIYPLPKIHTARIASKLFGEGIFPRIMATEEEELTRTVIPQVKKLIHFETQMLDIARKVLAFGSAFVRLRVHESLLQLEVYAPNKCYPSFNTRGDLEAIKIQYVFEDHAEWDKDTKGPKKKWFCLKLTDGVDTLYNTPDYEEGITPEFTVVEEVEHNLGEVQGVWVKNTKDSLRIDGDSLIEHILELGDCISRNLSQADGAASYIMEPQTVFRGMTEDEVDDLTKSRNKSWHLGQEGEANFLEIQGAGLVTASDHEKKMQQKAQEVTRAIMHDPEKIVGSAQSAKAMEILNAPLVELVNELRPIFGDALIQILRKVLFLAMRYKLSIVGKDNLVLENIDWELDWGDIFEPTLIDFQTEVSTYAQATNANLISRETALRNLAKKFQIEDVEKELARINAQPQLGGGLF